MKAFYVGNQEELCINLLAQKHDRLKVQQNKASRTARTLMPLIAALETYK